MQLHPIIPSIPNAEENCKLLLAMITSFKNRDVDWEQVEEKTGLTKPVILARYAKIKKHVYLDGQNLTLSTDSKKHANEDDSDEKPVRKKRKANNALKADVEPAAESSGMEEEDIEDAAESSETDADDEEETDKEEDEEADEDSESDGEHVCSED